MVTIGIDLAKNVFPIDGVDDTGKAMLAKPRVPRGQLATLTAQLPACLIGMEACSGAHHGARIFQHGPAPRSSSHQRRQHRCQESGQHAIHADGQSSESTGDFVNRQHMSRRQSMPRRTCS